MDINKYFQSKTFKIILWAIAGLIIFLLIFRLGMLIGFQKANFSYQWGENYHRNFGGPKGGFFGDLRDNEFPNPHGVFGQIIKIETATGTPLTTLTIKEANNLEKYVLVDDKTSIVEFRNNLKITDLKLDDNIVVIGDPNNYGQIAAKLIRIMPPPAGQPPRQPLPMGMISPESERQPININ